MSWIPPVSRSVLRNGVKYGVKYGPQAKILWDTAGKQARSAAKARLDDLNARRTAFDEAETVVEGTVLRRVWHGTPVWVVFSRDEPVSAYPAVAEPAEIVINADVSRRQTPQQFREARLWARARRAGAKARRPRALGGE